MAPTPSKLLLAATTAVACLSTISAHEAVRSVEARVYAVGTDYFAAGLHDFKCELVPTDGSPCFYSACTREQARDLGGDEVVTLDIGPIPAAVPTLAVAATKARLGIVRPTTQVIRATSGGRRRGRRHVPDGPRSILMMLVNYADMNVTYATEASARLMMQNPDGMDVAELYGASSYDRISWPDALTTVITVNSPLDGADLPAVCDDYVRDLALPTGGLSALALVAEQHPNISVDDFVHKTFFIPRSASNCGWDGIAFIDHCHDSTSDKCKSFIRSDAATILAHELGHNLGARHASNDLDDDGILEEEYGDAGSIMGMAPMGGSMNGPHRLQLGYLGDGLGAETYDMACAAQPSVQVTLNISRLDLAPGGDNPNPNIVRIARFPSSNYLLSFKALADWDGVTIPGDYRNRLQIHTHAGTSAHNTMIVKALGEGEVFTGRANRNGTSPVQLTIRVVDIGTDVITVTIDTDCATRDGETRPPTPAPAPDQNRQGDAQMFQGDMICGETVSGTTALPGTSIVGSAAPDHIWHFTLGQTTAVTLDGCDSAYDTVIRVFDRALLTELAHDDDACGSQSRLSITLPAGDYSIVMEGYGPPDQGDYSMTVDCLAVDAQTTSVAPPTPAPTAFEPTPGPTPAPAAVVSQPASNSIAFTSRPIIKVNSGQMRLKAIMEYDFVNHPGSCAGGEPPAIYTWLHSTSDSSTAGVSGYPYSLTRSRGKAKQAISVDSYVSGQADLQLDAWGPCAAGDANNIVATLTGFTYAYLAIVSPAKIRGPIDGVYSLTITFDYDIGELAGEFQAKASLKLDSASGSGPSSTVSLGSTSGTASIIIDVSEQFSAVTADAPSTLLLFIGPEKDFTDFSNRVISTTQVDFTYVEDFGPNGRQVGDTNGGSMAGSKGGKGGKGGEAGGIGMGEGGGTGKGKGKGKGSEAGKGVGPAAAAGLGFAAPAAAAKSSVGIASIILIAAGTAFVAVRMHRSSPTSETEELLPKVDPEL